MATQTIREKVQNARSVKTVVDAVNQIADEQKVPQLRDLLLEMDKAVSKEKIAEIFKMTIDAARRRDANVPQKAAARNMVVEYMTMLKQYQQMTGEITQDEISKMADMEIDALLRDEYGLVGGFAAAVKAQS